VHKEGSKIGDSFEYFSTMNYENIISDLKQKKYAPVYFLMGDEPYYIDLISDYIATNTLQDSEKAFNQSILYGKDVDIATITDSARRFPMMSQHQVIIVREAQSIREIDNLIYYVTNPQKSTILVINYKNKKLDKRKKLYKEIEKNGVLFESSRLYEDKIPDWISKHLKEKGCSIEPTGALLLTELLGSDLGKIAMELKKLMITLPEGNKLITVAHIEENIGISKDFNNIELQKALVKQDALKAFRIIDYFSHNEKNNPMILTIASLYFFFNKIFLYHHQKDKSKQSVAEKLKINPFFVADYQQASRVFPAEKTIQIISWLREYDLKSKGVNNLSATTGDLLKELIYKILKR
jgi:DNA polymerase III subunit delta